MVCDGGGGGKGDDFGSIAGGDESRGGVDGVRP